MQNPSLLRYGLHPVSPRSGGYRVKSIIRNRLCHAGHKRFLLYLASVLRHVVPYRRVAGSLPAAARYLSSVSLTCLGLNSRMRTRLITPKMPTVSNDSSAVFLMPIRIG